MVIKMARKQQFNSHQTKKGCSIQINGQRRNILLALNAVLLAILVGVVLKKEVTSPLSSSTLEKIIGSEGGREGMEEKDPNTTDADLRLAHDSVINLDHGDPTMFEPFWKVMGARATVVIHGWEKMSYFSDPTNLCWFLEPEFANQVLRLHQIVNNAATDGRHIIVGVGSTQLVHAALYALASTEAHHPVSVVSAAPYYSMYSGIADFFKSGLFHWAGDATTFKGDDNFIELVCSPNNPDGATRDAVLGTHAGKRIHDMAYYWPQYSPMRGPADHDVMLFTVSKATGHAGTRIGWAVVKNKEVAQKMVKFIEMNSIGVSKDSQIRAARILKVISDGYEFPDPESTVRFFHFGRHLLANRWQRLRQAVEASGWFSLPQFSPEFCEFFKEHAETYPGFAWVRCEEGQDCEAFFKTMKVLSRSGKHFGAGSNYVRISMLDRDTNFDTFIKRISSKD
ncbi:Tryptophan aminotransferase-related protein 2 [Rhynchospora pubera]|uniref:Tryptophan aminotransferase-related protein 2 n=1 Tax=Rhynchospora pubera TaxID=906938 RepID=A0AAV8FZ57_9POAL|nr:Tryptophan aminotransferase-related protein 2 [Rhynchospora pubera]